MNKATLVVGPFYQNNKIFDLNDKIVNRDNCIYSFYLLKCGFERVNINLSTQDINSISDSQIVIYNEMPKKLPQGKAIEKSYLLIFESELIRPDNWNMRRHNHFKKIFTWNDDFVDNIKYFKMNFSLEIPESITRKKKEKLCTLIVGNKSCNNPKELYSERIRAIRWFENNHLEDFDFYGMGWDKYTFKGPFGILNRFAFLSKLFASKFWAYKGVVESKKEVLAKYSFSICYENAKDIPGYITEKIFDSFFAGCVPIYCGAPNITDYIPVGCFIDKTMFNTYEELYQFLIGMSEKDYKKYLENIEQYLQGEEIKLFSSEYFTEIVINECVEKNMLGNSNK